VGDDDHVRDLLSGRVRAEGIELLPVNLPVEEIFFRFTQFREWDVWHVLQHWRNRTGSLDRGLLAYSSLSGF
jgi:hypothetical protein